MLESDRNADKNLQILIKERIRNAKAALIKTKTQLERVRKPKIKKENREKRNEYSDEKDCMYRKTSVG